MLAINCIF